MKSKIICSLIALAAFMLGAPIDSDAHGGKRGHYKQGYRAGYRTGYRQAYRAPRYYAPRPAYRAYSYARPVPAYGYRPRVVAPVRVWVPAQRVWGPRGWHWRRGYWR